MKSSLLNNYSRYPVEFVEGKGARLFDSEGNSYLDFLSGIAVTGFGHNHLEITEAAKKQFNKLWHVSNLFEASQQEEIAEKLTIATGLDSVFFCNSGTEANEATIKFARKWGGKRKNIIAAKGGFHGRTMGSLSATGQTKLWEGFAPMLSDFTFVEFNNIEEVKESITPETCAIMIEPIQGESGVIVPSESYLQELRVICYEHDLLLILDEVQTGIGRTGKGGGHQWSVLKPEMVTAAKGRANGLPLGAVICNQRISEIIKPGDHGSTFGGNPIAIAAANKVLDLLTVEQLLNIDELGELLRKSIRGIDNKLVKSIRGKGLMIGVELTEPIAKLIAKELLLDNKIVIGNSGESVIRLLPPFVITHSAVEKLVEKYGTVLAKFSFSKQSSDIVVNNLN